jgi:hypothetical protein
VNDAEAIAWIYWVEGETPLSTPDHRKCPACQIQVREREK